MRVISYEITSGFSRRETYTSASVLLNLLNKLGKRDKCEACQAFYLFFTTNLIISIIHEHECQILFII